MRTTAIIVLAIALQACSSTYPKRPLQPGGEEWWLMRARELCEQDDSAEGEEFGH